MMRKRKILAAVNCFYQQMVGNVKKSTGCLFTPHLVILLAGYIASCGIIRFLSIFLKSLNHSNVALQLL